MLEIVTNSPQKTQGIGEILGRLAEPGDVFLLQGSLGSGKTCFTQGIAKGIGIEGYVTSPSYIIANEYRGPLTLYHVDLYRLEKLGEVIDLGLDDYFYGNGVCVVEWADRAPAAMPPDRLLITFRYLGETQRRLTFEAVGERFVVLSAQLEKSLPVFSDEARN